MCSRIIPALDDAQLLPVYEGGGSSGRCKGQHCNTPLRLRNSYRAPHSSLRLPTISGSGTKRQGRNEKPRPLYSQAKTTSEQRDTSCPDCLYPVDAVLVEAQAAGATLPHRPQRRTGVAMRAMSLTPMAIPGKSRGIRVSRCTTMAVSNCHSDGIWRVFPIQVQAVLTSAASAGGSTPRRLSAA